MIYYLPPDPWDLKRLRDKLLQELAREDPDSIFYRLKAAHEKRVSQQLNELINHHKEPC